MNFSISTRIALSRRFLTIACGTLLAFAAPAFAADPMAAPAEPHHHGALSDAHLAHLIEFIVARVDEPQKQQVGAIAHTALPDLLAIEERADAVRAPRAKALLGPSIDRKALEGIRVAELRLDDERLQRVDRLLIDVVSALTPAQRENLLKQMGE